MPENVNEWRDKGNAETSEPPDRLFPIAKDIRKGAKGPSSEVIAAVLWALSDAMDKHKVENLPADDVAQVADLFDDESRGRGD